MNSRILLIQWVLLVVLVPKQGCRVVNIPIYGDGDNEINYYEKVGSITIQPPSQTIVYNETTVNYQINQCTELLVWIDSRLVHLEERNQADTEQLQQRVITPKEFNRRQAATNQEIKDAVAGREKIASIMALWRRTLTPNSTPVSPNQEQPQGTTTPPSTPPYPPSAAPAAPECYRVVHPEPNSTFAFRNKPLSRAEINALNSCSSQFQQDGTLVYEAPNRADCILKKQLNESTLLGHFLNGELVEQLGREGSWYRVRKLDTGQEGYIAYRYKGVPTLQKASCY